ncbi:MAG: hypothetical protein KQA38_03860 [Candidatus Aenigmarchaeota archaeon]|nr:hypothetical protein [Candidatus Aenigmarchaeota archaeon]
MNRGRKPVERFCRLCGESLGFYVSVKYCSECLGKRVAGSIVMLQTKRGPDYRNGLRIE